MKPQTNPYPSPIVMKFIRYTGFAISKILWRIKFHNVENIPQDLPGGLVVASNHPTYFDAPWVILPIRRNLRFIAWDKLFNVFLLGSLIRYLGAFPVNIDKNDNGAYRKSVEVIHDGATLVIFPEGSREFADGKLLDFKSGAVRMALEAGVPILPVTIRGANRVWAREMKFPRIFRRVEVFYHPLFEVQPPNADEDFREYARKITKDLKQIIESPML